MFSRLVIVVSAVVMTAGWMIAPTYTHAAVVIGGGASLYTNAITGATMTGEIGGAGSPTIGTLSSMTNPATQFDYSKNLRFEGAPTTSSITATLGSATDVGTIISTLNYYGPPGTNWSNGADWAFSVNGSTVGSGTETLSATASVGGIQFVTIPAPQSATTVTMSLSNLPTYGGGTTHYADYHTLIALTESVKPVTTLTASSPVDGGALYTPGQAIVFASNRDEALTSAFWAGPTQSGYLQIGVGGNKTLTGVLLGSWAGAVDLAIKDDQGNIIATVSISPSDNGLLLPIKFATPVTTTYLQFEPTGAGAGTNTFAINEVIPLAEVPEPTTLGILSIALIRFLPRRPLRAHGR